MTRIPCLEIHIGKGDYAISAEDNLLVLMVMDEAGRSARLVMTPAVAAQIGTGLGAMVRFFAEEKL